MNNHPQNVIPFSPSGSAGGASGTGGGDRSNPFTVSTLATGLKDPVGLARDPRSGLLVVAQPARDSLAIIVGATLIGTVQPRFETNPLRHCGQEPAMPVKHRRCSKPVRSPVDVLFDDRGHLFVAESCPGGRILAFRFAENGFAEADVVSCPCNRQARAYSFLGLDERGRLCAISRDVSGDGPATHVEVYEQQWSGFWRCVEVGAKLPFPFPTGQRTGCYGKSQPFPLARETQHERITDPVLAWLYAQPDICRFALDPVSGDYYATSRKAGKVLRLRARMR